MDRRMFLGGMAAGAAGLTIGQPSRGERNTAGHRSPATAMNVIFMVSDGMSAGTLQMSDALSRERTGEASHWARLWKEPGVNRCSVITYSANGYVTDSAAGGSAWGCGVHVNNGAVNMTPDGREPTPILLQAKAAGKATGLVTTTRITHATPASFIANVPDRGRESVIAEQILDRGVDVALGGGSRFFPADLLARRPELTVFRSRDELAQAGSAADGPILGLFSQDHMAYELDRDSARQPSLAEMTEAALARLARCSHGFVLQVEGGRVDHGAHANDVGATLYDQLAFDEATGRAAAFAVDRDDTLLIITTDHGTGGPNLTYYADEGMRGFARVHEITRSFEWIGAQRGELGEEGASIDATAELIRRASGVELSVEERQILKRCIAGERVEPFSATGSMTLVLGSLLANHFGIGWVSGNHTSEFVELTALGPGSEGLAPLIENTDCHGLMVRALDLAPVPG